MAADLPEAQGVFLKPRLPEGPLQAGLNGCCAPAPKGRRCRTATLLTNRAPGGFRKGARQGEAAGGAGRVSPAIKGAGAKATKFGIKVPTLPPYHGG